jgi:hypothetical protein
VDFDDVLIVLLNKVKLDFKLHRGIMQKFLSQMESGSINSITLE